MRRAMIVAILALAATGAFGSPFIEPSYVFDVFDVPGSTNTQAHGINSRGDIVGQYTDASGVFHGFVLRNGQFSRIDVPSDWQSGIPATRVYGINNRGQMVGQFGRLLPHGFLLSGTLFVPIEFPGSLGTHLSAINDSGTIVGSYQDDRGAHGFLLYHGVFTTIDIPGSITTAVNGINDVGAIVGTYIDALQGQQHGFLLSRDTVTTIDVPGTVDGQTTRATVLQAINNRGDIVGSYSDDSGRVHGFVLAHGTYTTIDPPDGDYTNVLGISAQGLIVGLDEVGSVSRGFLAMPQEGHAGDRRP